MKMSKIISRILLNLLLVAFVSAAIAPFVGVAVTMLFALTVFTLGFIPKGSLGLNMALQTEIWVADIEETLYQNSMFLLNSVSHDAYVSNKTVHVPQSGSKPNVEVDRSVLPAVISERTDTDFTYDLNEFSTDPILIRNVDELQISYDKRKSVTNQHMMTLSETVGTYIANDWAPTDYVLTTGSASASALAPGATGTRLAITLSDIANLAKKLDNDLVPSQGRFLMLPVDMFYQLLTISEVLRASYNGFMQNPSVIASGVVGELMGFKIIKRPVVNVFATGYTKKAVGAATATTDDLAGLAWHQDYVAKALGAIDVFADSGDNGRGKPEYYGILLSALVMMGGKYLRNDRKGVVNLVQANS